MIHYPTNSDTVIDSRDVIEALADLAKFHVPGLVVMDGELYGKSVTEHAQHELLAHEKVLTALANEAAQYSEDWAYGSTLVRDSHFQTYAEDLANDVAGSSEEADLLSGTAEQHWPFTFMVTDWEAASEALKQDYTSVDFDGVTYWVR